MQKKEPETSNTAVRPGAIIYCDGCCQPNPGTMAIGVYCDDPEIRISRVAGYGTNNEAECLAAIAALEEAKRLGLSGIELRCDSRLVVGWARRKSKLKSKTARQCVPQIKSLLAEVGAHLTWIPGTINPADALSRQHEYQPDQFSSDIERINHLTHDQLRFGDFVALKSGRDEFSRLNYLALVERIPAADLEVIRQEFVSEKQRASVIRWMLRGLDLARAIRKVATDTEVAKNVRRAK